VTRRFFFIAALFLVYAPTALADAPSFFSPASIAPTNPAVGTKLVGSNGSPICAPTCDANAVDGHPQPYMTILPGADPPAGIFFAFSRCNNAGGCMVVQAKSTTETTYTVQPEDAGSWMRLTVTATNLNCAETRRTDFYTECRYTSAYSTADTAIVPFIITISPATLPDAVDGTAYNQTVTGTGGPGPYAFSVASGVLPPGLALTSGGALTGTPTRAGSYTFTVGATGVNATPASKTYALSVKLGIGVQKLAAGTAGTAYSQKLAGDPGGTAPFVFTVTSGLLPPGLTLLGDTVSGTPTKAGSYTFTVSAIDANKLIGTGTVTIDIAWPTLTVAPSTLGKAVEKVPYRVVLTTTGGVAPYKYALASGALPPGLSLGANGVISGTPTGPAGDFTFIVGIADANGAPATVTYVVHYLAPDIVVGPAKLQAGAVGVKLEQRLVATGGHGPYTFSLQSGKLPSGVALGERGMLIGTPTTAGTYRFVVKATDRDGAFTTKSLVLVIK